ncbi:hypothetical protein QJS04_geneDACA001155 [Acorus gramineus]|uniref:Uncharacterized protein n=1 Tax=Acorus gramineus TaxID=55184 RepID=A0AAV9AFH8_ACOGR|nr:hypothetical protein QJS04_geneDACA001155 [Acorus gramineus]
MSNEKQKNTWIKKQLRFYSNYASKIISFLIYPKKKIHALLMSLSITEPKKSAAPSPTPSPLLLPRLHHHRCSTRSSSHCGPHLPLDNPQPTHRAERRLCHQFTKGLCREKFTQPPRGTL